MSIRASTLVWERTRAKGSNLLMLLAIADYAHDNGRGAYPSARTLTWKTRLSGRGTELVLRKLIEDGELEPEWNETEKRLYLHIRCVANWDGYQGEGPVPLRENISRNQRANFSQRLVETFEKTGKPAAPSAKTATRKAKSAAPLAKTATRLAKSVTRKSGQPVERVRTSAYQPSGSVTDPSADPSGEPSGDPIRPDTAGAAPRSLLPETDATFALLVKLAHEALDLEPGGSLADVSDALKSLCRLRQVTYDGFSRTIAKAIDAARWQRTHRHQEAS